MKRNDGAPENHDRKTLFSRYRSAILSAIFFMALGSFSAGSAQAGKGQVETAHPEGISASAWSRIMQTIENDRYAVVPAERSPDTFAGRNPRQGFSLSFADGGIDVSPVASVKSSGGEKPGWGLGVRLAGFGYGDVKDLKTPAGEVTVVREGARVEYRRPGITEWYENRPEGIEQGFVLPVRPGGGNGIPAKTPLRILLSFSTGLTAHPSGGGAVFQDSAGRTVLRYDSLHVTDAKGKELASAMEFRAGDGEMHQMVALIVQDAAAVYPIIVDPLLSRGEKKIIASDGAAVDRFGISVAVSGDTVVVGANFADVAGKLDQGAAYVFGRNTGGVDNWGQVRKLTASDGAAEDLFGYFVALSNDTVVVGAHLADVSGKVDQGAAYVFERNTGGADNWGEVRKLTAANGAAHDLFGHSVAVSGDTVVVGAKWAAVLGNIRQGAAYVFERNTGGADNWGEVRQLTASDGATDDEFGYTLALSGDTVVVGAYAADVLGNSGQGAAYVFERNTDGAGILADNWGEVRKLTATGGAALNYFGYSVALSNDTVVVGARQAGVPGNSFHGEAYVFERNTGGADNWGQVQKLIASDGAAGDYFGSSVAVSGDTAVVGAWTADVSGNIGQGAAYVFERNAGGADNWGEVQKLTSSDGAAWDYFGRFVAVSGDTVVVGASWADVSGKSDQGAAYIYSLKGAWWEAAKRTASDGAAGDSFGASVSLSGDTLAVGAYGHNAQAGAVYLFRRNVDDVGGITPDGWPFFKKLTEPAGVSGNLFGQAVALSGDTLAVGAGGVGYLSGTVPSAGLAYIFERNSDGAGGTSPDNWGVVETLIPEDHASNAGALFGSFVSLSNDTAVVGAPGVNKAYVFERNKFGLATSADNWGQVAKLSPSDGIAGDNFGAAVSISDDTAAVGAPYADGPGGSNQGKVYIFTRNFDPFNPAVPVADNWGEKKMIALSGGADSDYFGISVSLSGDTLLVGANGVDINSNADQGAAYIFERNSGGGDAWGLVQTVLASDGGADDGFGMSVSLDGNKAVVGAFEADVGGNANQGAAYVFERNTDGAGVLADNWGEVRKLTASDGLAEDRFAASVSLSGDVFAAGGPYTTLGGTASQGVLYVYRYSECDGSTAAMIGVVPYGSVQLAFDYALNGNSILVHEGMLGGPVILNVPGATITLEGGWDCPFNNRFSEFSEIGGPLTVTNGTLIVDQVTLR